MRTANCRIRCNSSSSKRPGLRPRGCQFELSSTRSCPKRAASKSVSLTGVLASSFIGTTFLRAGLVLNRWTASRIRGRQSLSEKRAGQDQVKWVGPAGTQSCSRSSLPRMSQKFVQWARPGRRGLRISGDRPGIKMAPARGRAPRPSKSP